MQIAALDDGAVVEVAVVDVVDGVAEDVAAVGFGEDFGVEFSDGSGGDDEERALEIFRFERFGAPIVLLGADEFDEGGIELGSDNVHVGSGFEETGNFLGGDDASADDEDAAVGEFKEGGKEGHGW